MTGHISSMLDNFDVDVSHRGDDVVRILSDSYDKNSPVILSSPLSHFVSFNFYDLR